MCKTNMIKVHTNTDIIPLNLHLITFLDPYLHPTFLSLSYILLFILPSYLYPTFLSSSYILTNIQLILIYSIPHLFILIELWCKVEPQVTSHVQLVFEQRRRLVCQLDRDCQ